VNIPKSIVSYWENSLDPGVSDDRPQRYSGAKA